MTSAKRILILTANVGMGHHSAARAVAAALRAQHPVDCMVELANLLEDRRLPPFWRKSGANYDRMVNRTPHLLKWGYALTAYRLPAAVVHATARAALSGVMDDLLRQHQPDAILTTYQLYQAPLAAAAARCQSSIPLITVVTDYAPVHPTWFHRQADLCLVPAPAVRSQALGYDLPPERVVVTGIPVHPDLGRGDSDPEAMRLKLGWSPDLLTVLAVGSSRTRRLFEILRSLDRSGLPLQLVVTAGGDDALYRQLLAVEWQVPVHLYRFVEELPALMRAADLVACKAGGLVIAEALACGLPLLLADVIEGQETGNARYVLDGEAGELVRNPVEAVEVVHRWLANGGEILAQCSRNAKRLGVPQAANIVAGMVWDAAIHRETSSLHPGRWGDRL